MPARSLSPATLHALFHHRWMVPVLVEIDRTKGAKFVSLAYRLGIPRDSLQRTLQALLHAALVMRNPGHGHPLRPEYLLTPRGQEVARCCAPLLALLRKLNLEAVGLKKWCMPVVGALGLGASRFSELKVSLPGVTARALTLALKELEASGLVVRTVTNSYPPIAHYTLTRPARAFTRRLDSLRQVLTSGA